MAMHSQIERKHHGSLLERYLGAARSAVRRAVAPLDVRQSTLNEAEQSLLRQLVEQASHHHGPIIEIGTLIGVTTSRMALWKSARQRIITVDNYRRNPWQLPPDLHYALTAQVLFCLVETSRSSRCEWTRASSIAPMTVRPRPWYSSTPYTLTKKPSSTFSGRAAFVP